MSGSNQERVTAVTVRAAKAAGRKLAMLTAYDATFARLLDDAGVDVLLVGDSLGMVIQGHDTTLPVTLEEMIYHCRAVARGAQRAHIVGDMPFMSYQTSARDALVSAGRLVKEGGAHAVKLEGGAEVSEQVATIVRAGIPVMAHVGLTPQSVHAMGGFKVQGRGADAAARIRDDARALEHAGAYAIVLEGIPAGLAAEITAALSIPTIGIGAGPSCDGQVLVIYDLLGMSDRFRPKFVKRYLELAPRIRGACTEFIAEVRAGQFPTAEHSFGDAPPAKPQPSAADKPTPLYGGVAAVK
jgi:3-methyl-2-oxobutanoate hydroxymethyltransferase